MNYFSYLRNNVDINKKISAYSANLPIAEAV